MNLPHLCLAEFHRDFRQKTRVLRLSYGIVCMILGLAIFVVRGEIKLWGEADLIS